MIWQWPDADALLSALGWAVVHFLWQGAAVALVVVILLGAVRQSSAARYLIVCLGLAACTLAFLVTLGLMWPSAATAIPSATALSGVELWLHRESTPIEPVECIAWLWLAGVAALSARLVVQWCAMTRLRTQAVSSPDHQWQQAFCSLRDQLGVSTAVRLVRSTLAETPMVVGWLAPVVLVPASAFTALSAEQLRSILAHELSHIRRYDHLVNAAQLVIETLLFFHPAIWWLSRQARIERENCCDDAAVHASGNPRLLAEALARLESLRIAHPPTALAANGGLLMNRITRILGAPNAMGATSSRWPRVAALAAAAVFTVAGFTHAAALRSSLEPPTEAEIDAYLESVIARLQEGIDAGQITVEQANAKLEAVQAHLALKLRLAGRTDATAAAAGARGVHRSGDEVERLKALQSEVREERNVVAQQMAELTSRLRALEQAGTLTDDEARTSLEALQRMRERQVAIAGALDAATARLHSHLQSPRLSAEQLALATARVDHVDEAKATTTSHLKALTHEIKLALEAGDLTPAEAELKLAAIHRMAEVKAIRSAKDLEAIAAHLHEAVEAGELSAEEAEAKLKAIHEMRAQSAEVEARRRAAALRLHSLGTDEALVAAATRREQIRTDVTAEVLQDRLLQAELAQVSAARIVADLDAARARLHEQVQAGQMPAEQAHKALVELDRARAVQAQAAGTQDVLLEQSPGDSESVLLSIPLVRHYFSSEAKAEGVPAATNAPSREQAAVELADRKAALVSKAQLHNSMKDLLTQLRAEVESGSMTIEEAQAALESLKSELTEKKRR